MLSELFACRGPITKENSFFIIKLKYIAQSDKTKNYKNLISVNNVIP